MVSYNCCQCPHVIHDIGHIWNASNGWVFNLGGKNYCSMTCLMRVELKDIVEDINVYKQNHVVEYK